MGNQIEDQQVSCLWQGSNILSVSLSGYINYLDINNPDKPLRVIRVRSHNQQLWHNQLALHPPCYMIRVVQCIHSTYANILTQLVLMVVVHKYTSYSVNRPINVLYIISLWNVCGIMLQGQQKNLTALSTSADRSTIYAGSFTGRINILHTYCLIGFGL